MNMLLLLVLQQFVCQAFSQTVSPVNIGAPFPYSTGVLTNTNSCNQNYKTACTTGCFGDILTFSGCGGLLTQDTYFKLYYGGDMVAENDDFCGAVSYIRYTVPTEGCNQYCLHMGCFALSSCSMNVTGTILASTTAQPVVSPTQPPSLSPSVAPTSYPSSAPVGGRPSSQPSSAPSSAPSGVTVEIVLQHFGDLPANSSQCHPVATENCTLRSAWAACATIPTYATCYIKIPPASNISFFNYDYGGLVLTEDFNIVINGQGSVVTAQTGVLPTPTPAGGDFPWTSGTMENTDYCSVNYTTGCTSGCFGEVITFSACEGDVNQDTYFKLYMGNNSYIPGSNETRGTLVAENDDSCGGASSIQYAVTESGCNEFCLNMGCFGDLSCVANVTATRISDLESPRFIYYLQNRSATSNFVPKLTIMNIDLAHFGGDGLNGGVVYLSGKVEATFSDVLFHNSSGGLGGSLYFNENSESVIIQNCRFIYNSAEFGGAIYLDSAVNGFLLTDSEIRHCNGTGGGGGIYVAESNIGVSIVDSQFENCVASSEISSSGGAIVLDAYNDNFLLSGTSFENCRTRFFGGALASLEYNDNTIITGCSFNSCYGEYGGAIFVNQYIVGFTVAHTAIDSCFAFSGSGGGLYILYDIDQVSIYDVSINNCFAEYHAGGLYLFVFVTNAVVIDTSITNSVAKESGGCMSARFFNGNIMLSNVSFSNCSAGKQGGGLSVSDFNAGMLLSNSTFDNCVSYSSGGAISIDVNNTLIGFEGVLITASSAAQLGGAISVDTSNTNIKLNNVAIIGAAALYNGGAVSINSNNANIAFSSIFIADAVAGVTGGGIYVGNDNLNISLSDAAITNATATNGGGLYFGSRNQFVGISKLSVTDSHALTGYGGGLYLYNDNLNITVIASEFKGCSAISGGGVVSHINNSFLSLVGCDISGNSASVYGAGLYIESDNSNLVVVDPAGFFRSTTLQSQHPYISGYPSGNVAFTIFSETVSVQGATSFVVNFAAASDIDTTSDFINIYTSSNMSEASLLFSSTSMVWPGVDVPSLIIDGDSFFFEFVGSNSFDVTPTAVQDNLYGFTCFVYPVMSGAAVQPAVFSSNSINSGSGGGIYLHSSNSFPVFLNTLLNGNSAKQGGGLFFRDNNNGVVMVQVNITNNVASFDGGGLTIYVTNYGYVIAHCVFAGNTASRDGGALYLVTGNGEGEFETDNEIRISRSMFVGNSAPVGGAVFASNDNIAVYESCRFDGNGASVGSGGAIYLQQGNIVTMSNCILTNNSANGNGGGVSSAVSNSLTFNNVSMTSNYADEGGGALEYRGSTDVTFGGSNILQGNSARFAGGAVVCMASSLWSMANGTSIIIDSNHASVGSAVFFRQLQHVTNGGVTESLHDMVISNNVATVGGTLYWLYDSLMTQEPAGILSDSMVWEDNEAPYGVLVGTQATSLLGPETYEVSVYDQALDPPISLRIYDFYGHSMPLNGTTSVSVSVGDVVNCGTEFPSLSGDDMTGDGVTITNGVAEFASLSVYCTPSGNMTLQFEAQLGDVLGISASQAEDYYISNTTQLFFRECIAGESYTSRQCVECAIGTYSLLDNSDRCNECQFLPGVTDCYGDQIFLSHGYYRLNDLSSADSVMACPNDDACVGGNVSGQACCAPGYTGPLCKVCDVGYFGVNSMCLPCTTSAIFTSTLIGYVVLGILMLVVAAVAFAVYARSASSSPAEARPTSSATHSDKAGSIDARRQSVLLLLSQASGIDNVKHWVRINRPQITTKLKIIISTYQIITACSVVLAVTMPPSFVSFSQVASFLNLNVADAIPFSCSSKVTFIDHLELVTLLPMILCGVLVVIFSCEYLYHRRIIQSNRSRRRGDKRRKFEEVRDKYASYFFYLTYIVLPSVTVTIFEMFPCTDMDPYDEQGQGPQLFLTADMSISCTSEYYYSGVVYASIMILVYPIGIPLMYFCTLYKYRDAIRMRDDIVEDVRDSYLGDPGSFDSEDIVNPLGPERQRTDSANSSGSGELGLARQRTQSNLTADDDVAMDQYLSQFNVPINVRRVSFLWASYQPKYWYWEVIETTRRLMLTAVLSVCAPGTAAQGVLSLVLAIFYIRLCGGFSPYTRVSDNILSEVGQLQVFFTFFCALIVQNQLLGAELTELIGGSLVVVNLSVLAICVFSIFYSSYSISVPVTGDDEGSAVDDSTKMGVELTEVSSVEGLPQTTMTNVASSEAVSKARIKELERMHAEAALRVKDLERELLVRAAGVASSSSSTR